MGNMLVLFISALIAGASAAVHAPSYGYAPEFYCRDTNTSVYAEVCVPDFAEKVTPVTLAVKEEVVAPCTTTQVTYDQKSGTMKVTACGAAGYGGYGHQAAGYGGEHQVCREEYQTQAYKVPLVTVPLEQSCMLAYPAAKQVCVTKAIEITEVKCEDKVENKCFNVAKFVDATNTVD